MTSLPEPLVQFRTDLEEAIRRDQATRGRQRERRRRIAVLAVAALVAIVGTASAFATANGFSKLRELLSVEPFALGEQTRIVEGVRFSFTVAHGGWENGPAEKLASGEFRNRGLFVSKSTVGPQGAEAVVFWTGFLHRSEGAPCGTLFGSAIDGSIADLATAVAQAPGTELIRGPTRVTVGGRRALYVVLRVREDRGCDPGYFFAWTPRAPGGECWGACWLESNVGDNDQGLDRRREGDASVHRGANGQGRGFSRGLERGRARDRRDCSIDPLPLGEAAMTRRETRVTCAQEEDSNL